MPTTTTIQIGRKLYTATPCALGFDLRGPRGGSLLAVRNIRSGQFGVMQGARTICWLAADAFGAVSK